MPRPLPPFKEKDRELIEWYRREIAKRDITVHLNTEVTDVASLGADEVIVATGAVPKKLPIPGLENAMEATEYLYGRETGEKVVIVGGGLTGCEIAYDLIRKGKTAHRRGDEERPHRSAGRVPGQLLLPPGDAGPTTRRRCTWRPQSRRSALTA